MHKTPEHDLPNRFPRSRRRRARGSTGLRDLARGVLIPVGLLCIAALSAGCNQIFGLTPTELAPPDAYTCDCACNGSARDNRSSPSTTSTEEEGTAPSSTARRRAWWSSPIQSLAAR